MAGSCGAFGNFGKLLVQGGNSPRTFSGTSEKYFFLYETLGSRRSKIGTRAITGSRAVFSERQVAQPYVPRGVIAIQPGPADLDAWLPRITGGTKDGGGYFVPGLTLPSFDVLVSRDNGVFRYNDCIVGRGIFRGRRGPSSDEGEILELVLEIYAKQELLPTDGSPPTWPGTEPADPSGATRVPYAFYQGELNLNSNIRFFDSFNLVFDNRIMVQHRNSLTPTCLNPNERAVFLQTQLPFTVDTFADAENLFDPGAPATLTFTSGGCSFVTEITKAQNILDIPTIRGKSEIPINLTLQAQRDAGTAYEIRFKNDSTP